MPPFLGWLRHEMCEQLSNAVGLLSDRTFELLPDNILDIDTKSVKCFLCDQVFITGDSSYLLFNQRIESDGSSNCPLSQILSNALNHNIDKSTAHSSLLCSACNDIALEYEQLEQKLSNIRLRIMATYNATFLKLNDSRNVGEFEKLNDLGGHQLIENIADKKSRSIDEVLENSNSNEFAEEIIEEELSIASKVFDSFELIGGTTELHDEIKLLADDNKNLSVDTDKYTDMIIYEKPPSENEPTTFEDQNSILMENDETESTENFMEVNNETDEINQNYGTLQERNNSFSCSLCDGAVFLDAKSCTEHVYSVHKLRVHCCELCNSLFQRKQDLIEHTELQHNMKSEKVIFECEICNTYYDNFHLYRAHKRNMHSNFPNKLECLECNKKFKCQTALEGHMNNHYGIRPFQCEKCPKKFSSNYSLQVHMKTHGKRERPHKCDECGKAFLTLPNLQHHKMVHNEKLFECEICKKTFATQYNLQAHSIVHTGKRPFQCSTCNKSFARRAEVIDHERIHTGDRPFKCDICEMAFSQRSNLTAHKKTTHLKVKLHECAICKRSFKRRRLLEYHTRATHTGERPYKCETCGSSFVYPEHFKKHMHIHTGVKPFECEVCGKRFSSRDNRNAHRFVHSEKKPYECIECGAGFMRKPQLLAHMKQSQHISDTIIINPPQISEAKVETATFTEQPDDASLEEFLLPDNNNEKTIKKVQGKTTTVTAQSSNDASSLEEFGFPVQSNEKVVNEDDDMCKNISLEDMVTSASDSSNGHFSIIGMEGSKNGFTVHHNDAEYQTGSEGIVDTKFLVLHDFNCDDHQTLSWEDIAGDKD